MKKRIQIHSFCLGLMLLLFACTNNSGTPKPRAYPKVDYPEKNPTRMSFEQCPFSFEFPNYGALQKTKRKKGEKEYDCWFDIYIEQFDARVHCSYSSISSQEQLEKSIEDAFLIAGKVNERSDFMEEVEIKNKQGAEGLLMRFEGPAASPAHFYLTDQKQHFLKASLYFNTQINPDSLAPINLFLMEDIARMIETFEWKG